MEWTSDTTGRRYTTTQGSCQGTVWQNTTGQWTATVHSTGLDVGQRSCAALADAQAWCEAQITALVATGRCAQRGLQG